MFNGKYISLKEILWQVYNLPYTEELNYTDAAEYAVDAIRLIGAPLAYIDKVEATSLVEYKAALPDNIITIKGVKLLNAGGQDIALRRATDLYHPSIPCNDSGPSINTDTTDLPNSPYDESNQGVNTSVVDTEAGTTGERMSEYTYITNGGVIQSSVKEGNIEIAYQGLACDTEGFPLIPDNIQVKEAIRYYITYRYLEPLWGAGKVTDKWYNNVEQKKSFYMGAANTSMQLQGIDHLESTMNAVNRLIVNDKAYDNFYIGAGQRERIKRYH